MKGYLLYILLVLGQIVSCSSIIVQEKRAPASTEGSSCISQIKKVFRKKVIRPSQSNQGVKDFPLFYSKFWQLISPKKSITPEDWIPGKYLSKTFIYKGKEFKADLLGGVEHGFIQKVSSTYESSLKIYKDPHSHQDNHSLTIESYKFLHVTSPKASKNILEEGPRFSPGIEMVETARRSGKYKKEVLGKNFYSAFYTTMDRGYLEEYASRMESRRIGKRVFGWDVDNQQAPVMLEVNVDENAKVLDMRRGLYTDEGPTGSFPGLDTYKWYSGLSDSDFIKVLKKVVPREVLEKYPYTEKYKNLWRSPQTFAHLLGADIVNYSAGLSGGSAVQELNIINPGIIINLSVKEAPVEQIFLKFKY